MDEATRTPVEWVQSILEVLLTWVFLSAISIILSGHFICARLRLGIRFGKAENVIFKIPLVLFKIEAEGEQVCAGFASFLISFLICIALGGKPAYLLFNDRSGIDIGQWNSLCFMASLLSLLISLFIYGFATIINKSPVLMSDERDRTLKILEEHHKKRNKLNSNDENGEKL